MKKKKDLKLQVQVWLFYLRVISKLNKSKENHLPCVLQRYQVEKHHILCSIFFLGG